MYILTTATRMPKKHFLPIEKEEKMHDYRESNSKASCTFGSIMPELRVEGTS